MLMRDDQIPWDRLADEGYLLLSRQPPPKP